MDLPQTAPSWSGTTVGKVMSRNQPYQRPTMGSKTFARVGNSDIGRRSVSIYLTGLTLGTGITSADFHNCGDVRYAA